MSTLALRRIWVCLTILICISAMPYKEAFAGYTQIGLQLADSSGTQQPPSGQSRPIQPFLYTSDQFRAYMYLKLGLSEFVSWGNAQVIRPQRAADWYAEHQAWYQQCIDIIRPLVESHASPQKWMPCVAKIDNDKAHRQEILSHLYVVETQEQAREQQTTRQLADYSNLLLRWADMKRQHCAHESDPQACQQQVNNWQQTVLTQLEQTPERQAYAEMLSKIHQAFADDKASMMKGEKTLSDLALTADMLYLQGL